MSEVQVAQDLSVYEARMGWSSLRVVWLILRLAWIAIGAAAGAPLWWWVIALLLVASGAMDVYVAVVKPVVLRVDEAGIALYSVRWSRSRPTVTAPWHEIYAIVLDYVEHLRGGGKPVIGVVRLDEVPPGGEKIPVLEIPKPGLASRVNMRGWRVDLDKLGVVCGKHAPSVRIVDKRG